MLASGDKPEAPVIQSRDELVAHIEQGAKPKSEWRIGTEHEKIPFYRDGLRPVPYEGPAGISALLSGLADRFGWRPVYDRDKIIALEDPSGRPAPPLPSNPAASSNCRARRADDLPDLRRGRPPSAAGERDRGPARHLASWPWAFRRSGRWPRRRACRKAATTS